MKRRIRGRDKTCERAGGPVLYSKPDCPLCREAEHAVALVFGRGRVPVLNILEDRELEDRYVFRIPVLALGEVVLAEGRITVAEVRAARMRARELHRVEGEER